MAQAAGNQFADMMDSDQSFETILTSFGITQRATNRLTEDYVTANDLMSSNIEQIKSVVNLQNKMYRSHATALHRCYINTAQLNRILGQSMQLRMHMTSTTRTTLWHLTLHGLIPSLIHTT